MSDQMPVWVRRLMTQTKLVVFGVVFVALVVAGFFVVQSREDGVDGKVDRYMECVERNNYARDKC